MAQKYVVQVRGTFGGSIGGWRPGITGSLNQTGTSDEEASTFDASEHADDAFEMIVAEGALAEDVRIIERDA